MLRRVLLPLLLSAFLTAPAHAAVVALETEAADLSVGDVFEVRLTFAAEGDEFLSAFLVDVFWTGASVVDTVLTDQLDLPGGTEPGDRFVNVFDDYVQLFAVSSNTDAQLAAGQAFAFTVATITLRATEAGLLTVTLGALREFSGADFGALDVAFAAEALRLGVAPADANPVPLPPAAALFALGLPLLLRRGR